MSEPVSTRPTPEEFFAAEQQKNACKVCIHPDREVIDRAFNNGVPPATMHRWILDHTTVVVGEKSVRHHHHHGHFKSE